MKYARNVTVAELLGMYNAAHFCMMFKKKTGCSPREYKDGNGS